MIDSAVIVIWITEDHWPGDNSTSSISAFTEAWDPATVGDRSDLPSYSSTRLATFILNPDDQGYAIPQSRRLSVTSAVKSHYASAATNFGFLLNNWADHGHDGFTYSSSEATDQTKRPMLIVYSKGSTGIARSAAVGGVWAHSSHKKVIGIDGRVRGSDVRNGVAILRGKAGNASEIRLLNQK